MIKKTLYLSLLSIAAVQAAELPDTGQTLCFNGSRSLVDCNDSNTGDFSAYPSQDGRFGRDAQAKTGMLPKVGGGEAGFDYTKVCNNGQLAGQGLCPTDPIIGDAYNQWGCTLDNTTGLMWELKVYDPNRLHMRHSEWTYAWYNPDYTQNGGYAGSEDTGDDIFYFYCANSNRCDTDKYIQDINAIRLCGYSDWRLPTRQELLTIVHYNQWNPSTDQSFFPDMGGDFYWTSTTSAINNQDAWIVGFNAGKSHPYHKGNVAFIILVRD